MSERGFIGKMLFTIGGLLAWAAHFTVIYAFNAVACARRFADADVFGFGIVPFVVGVATIVAAAATLAVMGLAATGHGPIGVGERAAAPFLRYVAVVLAILSLIAIVWNALPVFIVPPCA